jgi:hypothetical protein
LAIPPKYELIQKLNTYYLAIENGKYGILNLYDKIWYDSTQQIFHLFLYEKLEQPRIGFANADGQIVIDAILKNMSFFINDYAFVETAAGIGLMHKNGPYQIVPQPNAFQEMSLPLSEWMPLVADRFYRKWGIAPLYTQQEHVKSMLDTFKMGSERLKVENLLLEQQLPNFYLNGQNIHPKHVTNWYFYNYESQGNPNDGNLFAIHWNIEDMVVTPRTIVAIHKHICQWLKIVFINCQKGCNFGCRKKGRILFRERTILCQFC